MAVCPPGSLISRPICQDHTNAEGVWTCLGTDTLNPSARRGARNHQHLWGFFGPREWTNSKNTVTMWSCNPTPGHISREKSNLKRYMHSNVHSSTINNTKTWKQHKCPSTDEWIKKMCYLYAMEYFSVIKREWNNAICSNMDGPRDYHTKCSKSNRER